MYRTAIILAAILFCVVHAPAPDPRVAAAMNSARIAATQQADPIPDGRFYCPMDSDIRSDAPGKCPRCGMTLVEGIKDSTEYPINFTVQPRAPRVNDVARLTFGILEPSTLQPVRNFEVVHEKLYHVFVVSQDLSFFVHTHPERDPDEDFHLDIRFPKPGMYRVLSDFYPAGGTPQLIANTVIIPGDGFSLQPAQIRADVSPRQTENSHVELVLSGPVVARDKISLLFRVTPDEGIEPYLGAMAHMLAASSDLIDMMHSHPFQSVDARAKAFKELTFNMIFPREGVYRVWVQFQRMGIVNTVSFDVPVQEPR
jgi:Heavy metal binding domain